MRALFCGDRNWTDRELIAAFLADLKSDNPNLEICHGAARGADTIAGEEARKLSIPVTEYPADWAKHGRTAGPIRNRQMLTEFRPTLVCAFHDNPKTSRGTRHMVQIAQGAGIPIDFTRHGVHDGPPFD